jgi:hypothetical protein
LVQFAQGTSSNPREYQLRVAPHVPKLVHAIRLDRVIRTLKKDQLATRQMYGGFRGTIRPYATTLSMCLDLRVTTSQHFQYFRSLVGGSVIHENHLNFIAEFADPLQQSLGAILDR